MLTSDKQAGGVVEGSQGVNGIGALDVERSICRGKGP